MDNLFLSAFVRATVDVIGTMAAVPVTAGEFQGKQGNKSWGQVSGIMGLASESLSGNLIISFDKPSILDIVTKMLGEDFLEISADVVDAVGELTNMITGRAKALLQEQGHNFDMASPLILVGEDLEIAQLITGPIVVIPFKSKTGQFMVEVSLKPIKDCSVRSRLEQRAL